MKKYLITLVLVLFLYSPAFAQEIEDEVIETNVFGYPENEPIKVIDGIEIKNNLKINPKPDCTDPELATLAQKKLRPFLDVENQSVADKRKTKLVLKNVDNFSELSLSDIKPTTHRRAAGKILELKINNHLNDANIKVCQSDNPILSAKIYLIIYDDGNDVRIDIINFSKKIVPSFIFSEE